MVGKFYDSIATDNTNGALIMQGANAGFYFNTPQLAPRGSVSNPQFLSCLDTQSAISSLLLPCKYCADVIAI